MSDSWLTAFVPDTTGNSWIVNGSAPGEKWLTYGAFRAAVRNGVVELAADVPAVPFDRGFSFRNVWYFITQGGDIFSASTFLGPLKDVGAAVGAETLLVARAPERVLLSDRNGALWTFDGTSARQMTLPVPGVVTRLLERANGRPLAEVAGRPFLVRADGSFEAAAVNSKADESDDAEDLNAVTALTTSVGTAVKERERRWRPAVLALGETALLRDGSVVARQRVMPAGRSDCSILQAGAEPLVYCPPGPDALEKDDGVDAPLAAVFRLSASGSADHWLDVPARSEPQAGPGPSLLAHDDLSDLWLHEGKRETLPHIPDNGECESRVDSELRGLFGNWALVWRRCGASGAYSLLDLASKDEFDNFKERALAPFLPRGVRIDDAGLSAEHSTLWVLFQVQNGALQLALGPVAGTLEIEQLPAKVSAVAFVDSKRGVATGDQLGQVWSTVDGGAHWSQLTFPMLLGAASAVPIRERPACGMTLCRADGFIWLNPHVLDGTDYEPRAFVAPAHVPVDRSYPAFERSL